MGNDDVKDWLAPIFAAGAPRPKSDFDRAVDMAAADPVRALAIARGIVHPDARARALAVVARSIEPARAEATAGESLMAAWSQTRAFDQANDALPAIGVLLEQRCTDAARAAIATTRLRALDASPHSSRATVLERLLGASLPLEASVHLQLLDDLVTLQREDDYFRVSLAVIDALVALPAEERTLAEDLANGITNAKYRRRALREISRTSGSPQT